MANPAFRNLAKQLGMTHEWLLVTGATAEDDMTPDLDHVMKISRAACGNALSATSLGGGDRRGNLHRAMRRESARRPAFAAHEPASRDASPAARFHTRSGRGAGLGGHASPHPGAAARHQHCAGCGCRVQGLAPGLSQHQGLARPSTQEAHHLASS